MKKMLIIEEPESCETCPLRSYSDLMLMCTPLREAASDVECPLKPMPEKKERESWGVDEHAVYNNIHKMGWNDCIDAIISDTNGTKGEK